MTNVPNPPPPVNPGPPCCPTCGARLVPVATGFVVCLLLKSGRLSESAPFASAEHADRVGKLCLRDTAVEAYRVEFRD